MQTEETAVVIVTRNVRSHGEELEWSTTVRLQNVERTEKKTNARQTVFSLFRIDGYVT